MSIEQDIQQSRFRSHHQKAVVNLIFTASWINEKMREILEKEEITQQQFNILRILRGAGKPLSTMQIRQRMLDKMSDTSRIADRMVIKGLLKKKVSNTDKRLVDISISAKGLALLKRTDELQDTMDGIVGNLTHEEADTLNNLLDKIRDQKK